MKTSIIIPWRDIGSLWRNVSFEWVVERYKRLMPDAEIVLGDSAGEEFNRSQARNNAFAHSTGEIILIADADTIVPIDQIELAIEAIRHRGAKWLIPYSTERYYNLTPEESDKILTTEPDKPIMEPVFEAQWIHKITSWAGLLVLPRSSWEKVGGYDERFRLWGYEDNAFQAALDNRVGPFSRVPGYVLHLWHPAPESECFGQPYIKENQALYEKYKRGLL